MDHFISFMSLRQPFQYQSHISLHFAVLYEYMFSTYSIRYLFTYLFYDTVYLYANRQTRTTNTRASSRSHCAPSWPPSTTASRPNTGTRRRSTTASPRSATLCETPRAGTWTLRASPSPVRPMPQCPAFDYKLS